jgi:uncharacterized membrane protein
VRTDRAATFSDGVFAIAITLLVLEIHVPEVSEHSLWHDLGELWPSFAAYVVSFFTIGIIWVNHHAQWERIDHVNRTMLFVNLVLLLTVSFLPFPTALVAEHLKNGTTDSQHIAAAVYSAALLAMGVAFFATWVYATRAGLLVGDLTDKQVRQLMIRNVAGNLGYAAAVGLAFVSAPASIALCGLVALYYVPPGRVREADL